jgi:hypothetical protein
MNIQIQNKPKERGQSMVELALTITILMVLLAGTIDLGRAFFTWLALRDAAQEGASYGSFDPENSTEIISRIRDNLEQVIPDPDTDVTVNISKPVNACLGDPITVDVYYNDFPLTMPFLSTIVGDDVIPIHATINDTILAPGCK